MKNEMTTAMYNFYFLDIYHFCLCGHWRDSELGSGFDWNLHENKIVAR